MVWYVPSLSSGGFVWLFLCFTGMIHMIVRLLLLLAAAVFCSFILSFRYICRFSSCFVFPLGVALMVQVLCSSTGTLSNCCIISYHTKYILRVTVVPSCTAFVLRIYSMYRSYCLMIDADADGIWCIVLPMQFHADYCSMHVFCCCRCAFCGAQEGGRFWFLGFVCGRPASA